MCGRQKENTADAEMTHGSKIPDTMRKIKFVKNENTVAQLAKQRHKREGVRKGNGGARATKGVKPTKE